MTYFFQLWSLAAITLCTLLYSKYFPKANKPSGTLDFTLQSLLKCQLFLTLDCSYNPGFSLLGSERQFVSRAEWDDVAGWAEPQCAGGDGAAQSTGAQDQRGALPGGAPCAAPLFHSRG